MNELIKQKDLDRERYEFLLFERDECLKDAEQNLINFKLHFGQSEIELFELKVECIKIKRTIEYLRKAQLGNKQIVWSELQKTLEKEMLVYEAAIGRMTQEQKAAEDMTEAGSYAVKRAKELYHAIAKKIHPDLNPGLSSPVISRLWEEVVEAYQHLNVKRLTELNVQINKVLKDLDIDPGAEIEIPDIKEKIQKLEEEISAIKSEAPYNYIEFMKTPEAIEKKKAEIRSNIDAFKKYRDELKGILEDLKQNGGLTFIWMMN